MAKGEKQKQKLLYLEKFFKEETDENHGLSMPEIIQKLGEHSISAERKAIYQDLKELQDFGLDIISERSTRGDGVTNETGEKEVSKVVYKLLSRDFELPELKLLVDSVQSAKFISERKSKELIKKLESLVSHYQAKELQRQVIISGRVKTANENVYYSVDAIHDAIGRNRQIRFQYFQWNVKKEMELRHDGKWYEISPWALIWDNEYYYLLAYDARERQMRHYRVDKMRHLTVTEEARQGQELFDEIDLPSYARKVFGMYNGNEQEVTLECENEKAHIIIDRFGTDVFLIPVDENHFRTTLRVVPSEHFLGWVVSIGKGVRIVAPQSVVNKMQETIRQLARTYQLSEQDSLETPQKMVSEDHC